MINVEMNYNPYLNKLDVKFNEKEPGINSPIEKCNGRVLQDWISELPNMFRDEMNGYDFDFDFSGTELDFQDIKDAFAGAGVDDETVRLFHKNALGGRKEKNQKTVNLFKWLEQNPNRRFDFEKFRENNDGLFYETYSLIVLKDESSITSIESPEVTIDISIEVVNNAKELKDIELKNVPLIICVGDKMSHKLYDELAFIMRKHDVDENQIFLLIEEGQDKEKIIRTVMDTGIRVPQIIRSANADSVKRYLEIYPVTEFIYQACKALDEQLAELKENLKTAKEKAVSENRAAYERIEKLEVQAEKIRSAAYKFNHKDNVEIPYEWRMEKKKLVEIIAAWRNRKTRITRDDEAERLAFEYAKEIRKSLKAFYEIIVKLANRRKDEITYDYRKWYESAEFEQWGNVPVISWNIPEMEDVIFIDERLTDMRKVEYVEQKKDIVNKLFLQSGNHNELVRDVSYDCQEWRNYAIEFVEPKAELIMNKCFEAFSTFREELAMACITRLKKEYTDVMQEKGLQTAQLSEEEQQMVEDTNWVNEFEEQLEGIERG